jgi:hypothetical protein
MVPLVRMGWFSGPREITVDMFWKNSFQNIATVKIHDAHKTGLIRTSGGVELLEESLDEEVMLNV